MFSVLKKGAPKAIAWTLPVTLSTMSRHFLGVLQQKSNVLQTTIRHGNTPPPATWACPIPVRQQPKSFPFFIVYYTTCPSLEVLG